MKTLGLWIEKAMIVAFAAVCWIIFFMLLGLWREWMLAPALLLWLGVTLLLINWHYWGPYVPHQ